jgi:glutamyl-tRNA reductase
MARTEDLLLQRAPLPGPVLTLVGVNHRSASMTQLEQAALDEDGVRRALRATSGDPRVAEAVVVATCNRTEAYLFTHEREGRAASIGRDLIRGTGEVDDASIYIKFGRDAVAHLCRLAAGVDSLMIGEVQILGQVKQSYALAVEQRAAGPILGKLFGTAFRAGKRARSETRIGHGPVSLSYAALGLAQKIFSDLRERTVLVVGAGKAASLAARHFAEAGVGDLIIANRTLETAAKLAGALGGRSVSLDRLGDALAAADIVITAAASQAPIVTRELADAARARRGNRPLVFIDIAMPRNIDPRVNELEGVFVHDMSALESMVKKNLDRRRREIPRVEAIVAEEVERHERWEKALNAASIIRELRERCEDFRQREITSWKGMLSPAELARLDTITRSTINKLLHLPTTRIRRPREEAGDPLVLLAAARELFGLDDQADSEDGKFADSGSEDIGSDDSEPEDSEPEDSES